MSEFDLPPGEVTNIQLYMLVTDLRRDVAALRSENSLLREENHELREEVAELRRSFESAKGVTTAVKWIGIVGSALIALFEGIRRYLT